MKTIILFFVRIWNWIFRKNTNVPLDRIADAEAQGGIENQPVARPRRSAGHRFRKAQLTGAIIRYGDKAIRVISETDNDGSQKIKVFKRQ